MAPEAMPDPAPHIEGTLETAAGDASADTYGVYRVVRPLGEGASGRVFLAERTDFPQRVALKVFHSGFLTAGLASPGEPHLLASLDHRHIVRVLQQGVTPAGVRFLAMEFIDGEDIVTFCDAQRLPLAERVRLLLQVVHAVEHAHRHLVIHGDLKPANILVTREAKTEVDGGGGEVKLVDFGSAARPGDRSETTTAHTPAFASPEQRIGARITAASDIYSLGLLARLLLAGIPPTESSTELSSRAVLRLSTRTPEAVEASAAARGTTTAGLAAALRGDLDAILGKALGAAPEDRYGTAEGMAADLLAFAEGRTPAVRQAPFAERLRKWTRRHKLGAAMTAVLACALLFSAVGVTLKAAQARRSRREAQVRLRELVQLTGTLQSELYGSVRALPDAGASEKLLTDSAAATLDKLATSPLTDPTLRAELASQYAQLARLELEQARAATPAHAAAPPLALQHLARSLELTAPDDPERGERAHLLASLSPAR